MKGIAVIKLVNGETLEYKVLEQEVQYGNVILKTPYCSVTIASDKILYIEFYKMTLQEYINIQKRANERVDNK